ncbi:GL21974 [Drosophila persimilis]|uniref:GL21974 n=1 Tax=Drosophila persimilis TaxID=7234 RepID=B4GE82_DROPE|nr:probable multidrug resistance-associated protein lethal(2)03659 [Drosophila persimilis]XP_026840051.1 probable multidrug resistance-associated protein lethal(2)03659 [Drosophila persimilis]EDW33917.1 GL21974 [Drosophila persimilis]
MDSSPKPERKNPRQGANIFSQLIFAWALPLLYRGSRRGLNTDDLTECLEEDHSEQLGDRLEDEWYKEVERAHRKSNKPRLRNALFRCFLGPTIVNGLICLIYIVIKTLIPAVLAQLLLQFQKLPSPTPVKEISLTETLNRTARSIGHFVLSQAVADASGAGSDVDSPNALDKGLDPTKEYVQLSTEEVARNASIQRSSFEEATEYIWNDTYSLGCVLVGSTLFGCFLLHHVDLRQRLMGARMRIACCSLIYRKTLRVSMKTAGQTPAGYLINLLSNDVNRLDYGFIFVHWIWIMPMQAVLTCYLIWLRIGIPALVGVIGLLLKTIPVQTALSKLTSVLRMRIAERTDARVGIMNELVQGIQVIKMYAWERPFQAVVAEARRSEIQQIRYASYLRGFYLSTMVFTERSTLYITLAAAALMGQPITADFVFSAASYYNILQLVAAIWYPLAISFGAEALVSLRRIQDYLQLEGRDEKTHGLTHKQNQDGGDSRAVILKDINASWDIEKPVAQRTLQSINLQIEKGQLCAVIGTVGAGKSSLLQLLLGELPIIDGGVVIQGDLSYAAQEPWLFTGTVRKNILFGEQYDRKRYQEVTRCCALSTDFQQLSNGDKTVVGERGASLSGGQRARISLARAVYKPASIYLLDDPLSAVDAHVGRHLFDEVIGPRGRLAQLKATRVLVTHQVHFLSEADVIVIVDQGRILRKGTYQELINSELDFAKLLERPKEEETENSNRLNTSSPTISGHDLEDDDDDIPYIDGVRDGYQPLRKQSNSTHGSKSLNSSDQTEMDPDDDDLAEAQASGGISPKVWYEYFHAGSTCLSFSFMVFVMLMSQVVCSSSDFFSNIWTQQEHQRSLGEPTSFTTFECMYIYGGLIIAVVIMTTFRGFLFFKTCMHASKVLHDRMFGCILHATMRFFDTNPSGRILNRFSKDMGAIDELLPRAMMDFIQIALVMFGILIVISVVNPVLMAAMLVVAVIDMLILKLYLRPSQDLKRLEGICRSPVFSHLSSSLSGLAIIRSRQLQDVVAKEFDLLQDVHSSVWQLTMAANTALGLWLDCVSCVFLSVVTFSFIISNESTYSGNVGLAISQAMILTGMVQYGVRQVAESLQQMTSVERVLQYTELEQEPAVSEKEPPAQWPTHGQVELRDMSCRYDPNGSPVLKNLSLTIEAGWKVGIVGRTGAGKSSLIGALFRLAHIEGGIYIDGIETGTISLEILRTRISIIPQDPVLFSATIRYNLDPFERYTDAELWHALEDVELRGAIPGLDYMVTERGSNFSVGQRQLLCLARAILRNNKVLVLDEATANVDPQTDGLIQRTIRVKFQQCTVLTVAHRLHTVMDSDRIIVMDAGTAVEFDVPHLLLKKSRGHLRQMVEATGSESDGLKKVASDTFKRMQRQREDQRAAAQQSSEDDQRQEE